MTSSNTDARDLFAPLSSEFRERLCALDLELELIDRRYVRNGRCLDSTVLDPHLKRLRRTSARMAALLDAADAVRDAEEELKAEGEVHLDVLLRQVLTDLREDIITAGCDVRLRVDPSLKARASRALLSHALRHLVAVSLKLHAKRCVELHAFREGEVVRVLFFTDATRSPVSRSRSASTMSEDDTVADLVIARQLLARMNGHLAVDLDDGACVVVEVSNAL